MSYSEEELKQIEQLASIYMTISDIAVILDKNEELLRADIKRKNDPANIAYNRGKISSKIMLRKQEMQLAKVGSPLALDNVRKALMDMEDDE